MKHLSDFSKKNRPAWVPKFKMSVFDAMDLIHQSGGLAVLAIGALIEPMI